jgi:hypothetical protein
MIRFLHILVAQFERLFGPKPRGADRSRLMGMYLDQTNRPAAAGMLGAASQEREDGKFALNRRRAVARLP